MWGVDTILLKGTFQEINGHVYICVRGTEFAFVSTVSD